MSRINTNIPSLIARRVLGQRQAELNVSLERLSTGLRINRGKDDAAGLIASETLRSQLAAIGAALSNADRANKIVGIAEGGLQEVNALLIDLEDLVSRTANEAGLSDEEVEANQLEIDAILDTINRIATATEFQGKKLLDGGLDYTLSGVASGAIASVQVTGARLAAGSTRTVNVEVTNSAETAELRYTLAAGSGLNGSVTIQVQGNYGLEVFSFASGTGLSSIATAVNGSGELTGVSATVSGSVVRFNSLDYGDDALVTITAIGGSFMVKDKDGNTTTQDYGVDVEATINGMAANTDGLEASVRSTALSTELILDEDFAQALSSTTFTITGGGATFSLAPEIGLAGMASLGIGSVSTGSLGNAVVGLLSSLGSGQPNELSSQNFATAQRIVRAANKEVSSLRGRLGAFESKTLASTINSLQVASENTKAAESAIRDTDFAEEAANLTRSQIMVAAATTTLQLANTVPQNVLTLLG